LFLLQWVKHQIVPILCVIGVIAPFVGMSLIDTFYYSTVFGWILGFCCFIVSYIIISKRPDDDEATSSPSATET
jgi:SNF family Na+-dependent transporter